MKPSLCRPLCFVLVVLAAASAPAQSKQSFKLAREQMVEREIADAGVKDERVLESMRTTPRHEFVSLAQRKYAYFDMALPIGDRQTISPPFVVAYMTEQLGPEPDDKVLEIGTGSGYQAAVLSSLVKEVYTIEIVAPLGRKAERTLRRLRYDNVHAKVGDGFKGWPEHAPFDKIIVTCSPERVPLALVEQLREGGRMVVPVGERYQQNLYLFTKQNGELTAEALRPTLFVPMTGRAEEKRRVKPDPLNPQVANGSFEHRVGKTERADAWHYQRQMKMVVDKKDARDGDTYALFSNEDRGRSSRVLQGFAVDGRKIAELDVSVWVRGDGLRFGQNRTQWPGLVITYYDEARATIGETRMDPWMGTFDWTHKTQRLPVPLKAREAILRLGLLGGIGELSVDGLEIHAAGK